MISTHYDEQRFAKLFDFPDTQTFDSDTHNQVGDHPYITSVKLGGVKKCQFFADVQYY